MTPAETVCLNGTIGRLGEMGLTAQELLYSEFLYTEITTIDRQPLYLAEKFSRLEADFCTLYGKECPHIPEAGAWIERLLRENHAPIGGNIIRACLFIDRGDRPCWLFTYAYPSLYRGYEQIVLRPKAVLTNYELPLENFMTGTSATMADFAARYARRQGAGAAIRVNRAGQLISLGEYPLLAVRERHAATPALGNGARDITERRLLLAACRQVGLQVEERPVDVEQIVRLDELLGFTPQGILAVLCCNDRYYTNSTASLLARALPELTRMGLSGC